MLRLWLFHPRGIVKCLMSRLSVLITSLTSCMGTNLCMLRKPHLFAGRPGYGRLCSASRVLLALLCMGMMCGLTLYVVTVLSVPLCRKLTLCRCLITPWHRLCILIAMALLLQCRPRKVV